MHCPLPGPGRTFPLSLRKDDSDPNPASTTYRLPVTWTSDMSSMGLSHLICKVG